MPPNLVFRNNQPNSGPLLFNKISLNSLIKGKVQPKTCHEAVAELYSFLTSACLWLTPGPGRFTPGNDPVPIAQKAGWTPGPV